MRYQRLLVLNQSHCNKIQRLFQNIVLIVFIAITITILLKYNSKINSITITDVTEAITDFVQITPYFKLPTFFEVVFNVTPQPNAPKGWIVLLHLVTFWSKRSACAALGCRRKRIGPSGVCALHLAAGRNVGGHSTWHYLSFFLSESFTFLPERRQLGLQNFAWTPKSQKYLDYNPKKLFRDPPYPPHIFGRTGGVF
jgi:hypothetical protein